MFENMQKAQINHMMKFTRKDKKDFKRMLRQINQQRFNQRDYTYEYNNLEIYVTVYPGKHPTIELTTDYFPHTFSSDPDDIRYNQKFNWKNLQGRWDNDKKMYDYVVDNLVNYDDKIGQQFGEFKKRNQCWNTSLLTDTQTKEIK